MVTTVFRDTARASCENPDPVWLRGLIFKAGDDFWDTESGEAVLEYYEDGKQKAKLLLTGSEDYGFMVHHNFYPETERDLVLTVGGHTGVMVGATICGEPIPCPREYFVPKELAWEAIEHFLRTGQRKLTLQWEAHRTPV